MYGGDTQIHFGSDKLAVMLLDIFARKCLASVRPCYRPWSDRPKTDGSEGSVYIRCKKFWLVTMTRVHIFEDAPNMNIFGCILLQSK